MLFESQLECLCFRKAFRRNVPCLRFQKLFGCASAHSYQVRFGLLHQVLSTASRPPPMLQDSSVEPRVRCRRRSKPNPPRQLRRKVHRKTWPHLPHWERPQWPRISKEYPEPPSRAERPVEVPTGE